MNRIRTRLAATLLLLATPAAFTVLAQPVGGRLHVATGARSSASLSSVRATSRDSTPTRDGEAVYREIVCILGCYVRVGAQITAPSSLADPRATVPPSRTPNRTEPAVAPPPPATVPRQPQPTPPAVTGATSPDGRGLSGSVPATVPDGQDRPRDSAAPPSGVEQGPFGSTGTRGMAPVAPAAPASILSIPRQVRAVAVAPSGARVEFATSATDAANRATAAVTCQPASGSTFPIGTTRVACSAGDSRTSVATGSFDVVVEPPSASGRMRGTGSMSTGSQVHHVTIDIARRGLRSPGSTFDDEVVTRVDGQDRRDRFRTTLVTHAYFFDAPGSVPGPEPRSGIDQVYFAGLGTWNGEAGFEFQAVVVDAGEPGDGMDRLAITIRRAGGAVVAEVAGPLSDGNIDSSER